MASLLRAEGHPAAPRYTLSFMWNEALFARRRINARIVTETVMIHASIVNVLAGGSGFKDLVKELTDGRR